MVNRECVIDAIASIFANIAGFITLCPFPDPSPCHCLVGKPLFSASFQISLGNAAMKLT